MQYTAINTANSKEHNYSVIPIYQYSDSTINIDASIGIIELLT